MKRILKKNISIIVLTTLVINLIIPIVYANENAGNDGDDSEPIVFVNESLKQNLLNNPYNDINQDGEISEYEMSQITTIYVTGKLDDLKYATNLKSLYITIDNQIEDFFTIFLLNNLEILSIYGYSYSDNQQNEIDFTELNKLTKLKELSISLNVNYKIGELPQTLERLQINGNNKNIDMENISNLSSLKFLYISAQKIENFEKISNLTELIELNISMSYSYSSDGAVNIEDIDISKLEGLKKLTILTLNGKLTNFSSLKKLTNLYTLRITINNDKNLNIDEMMKALNELNVENLSLSGQFKIDLGTKNLNSEQNNIKIEELCAITKAIYTEGNKLYLENPNWRTYGQGNDGIIELGDSIPIDTTTVGGNTFYFYLGGYNEKFTGQFLVTWNVVEDGDKENEINIPDANLYNLLLDNYDLDDNKKITKYDLININDLEIENANIESIEGLQHLKNAKNIYAWKNKITDLTPITNLENIKFADFSLNNIQNIDCLENATVHLNRIMLDKNYIDTSKDSKAYNILKNAYIEEMKKHEGSAEYINDEDILEQLDNYIVYSQNYGTFADRTQEVKMEDAMKEKLIELDLDTDNNGTLTREELYNASTYSRHSIDLSGLGIKDISPLKYINIYSIILSNNNITDISDLAHKNFGDIDLSNNKISNIDVVKDLYNIYNLNLSNNNISNIEAIADIPKIRYQHEIEIEAEEMNVYSTQYGGTIDLTSNYIDVNQENNKNVLETINMEIFDILLDNQKEKPLYSVGDINGDGKVSLLDYGLVIAHVKRTKLLEGEQLQRADVNGDNKVTLLDYGLILAHVKRTKLLF